MKNRILSFVLALVMVLALVPATVIASSAAYEDVTVAVGGGTAAPGGIAYLGIYVSEESVGAYDGLVNIQLQFDLPEGITIVKDQTLCTAYVTNKDPYYFTNVTYSQFGHTSDAGALIATTESLEAAGGAWVATLAFDVADTVAPGTYTVAIEAVQELTYRVLPTTDTKHPAKGDIATVSGTIIVGEDETSFLADEYVGEGEDYKIPGVNTAGNVVTSLLDVEEDLNMISGEFGIVTVPATVRDSSGIDYDITVEGLAVKNPYDTYAVEAGVELETTLYYHLNANGQSLILDAYNDLSSKNKKKITMVNLLAAGVSPVETTAAGDVVVYGAIAIDDLAYESVGLTVKFYQDETLVKTIVSDEIKTVYTSLVAGDDIVASATDIENTTGALISDSTYLCGLQITGVPAGTYTVEVTMTGVVAGVAGEVYNVVSETISETVTVA